MQTKAAYGGTHLLRLARPLPIKTTSRLAEVLASARTDTR
jgi:hypothetical protein